MYTCPRWECCSKSNTSYFIMLVGWQQRLNLPANIPLHFVAVWQRAAEGQAVRMASDMEVPMKQRCVTEFLHVEKNCTHWHSFTLAEQLWRPNSGCEHSEVVGGAFSSSNNSMIDKTCSRQPCRFLWAQHAGSYSLLAKMHSEQRWLLKNNIYSWEFSLSNCVLMLFVSAVVSNEINRRHYFQSDLYKRLIWMGKMRWQNWII